MRIDLYIHLVADAPAPRADWLAVLGHIHQELVALRHQGVSMSAALDRLTQEVAQTKTVTESAAALLGQLSDLIRQNATDPVALGKLADDLDAQQQALAAAVEANTPAAPGGTQAPPVEAPPVVDPT